MEYENKNYAQIWTQLDSKTFAKTISKGTKWSETIAAFIMMQKIGFECE